MIHLLRQGGDLAAGTLNLPTGQTAPLSKDFCQQNLTETSNLVENRDTYFYSPQRMKGLRNLAGAVSVMSALAAPVEAQETSAVVLAAAEGTSGQVTDCVSFVREQRDLARENDIVMTRADQRALLLDCRNGNIELRIAQQQQIEVPLVS